MAPPGCFSSRVLCLCGLTAGSHLKRNESLLMLLVKCAVSACVFASSSCSEFDTYGSMTSVKCHLLIKFLCMIWCCYRHSLIWTVNSLTWIIPKVTVKKQTTPLKTKLKQTCSNWELSCDFVQQALEGNIEPFPRHGVIQGWANFLRIHGSLQHFSQNCNKASHFVGEIYQEIIRGWAWTEFWAIKIVT